MKHNQMRQVVFPILAAFIWGTAFVAQDMCADAIGAFAFNASRYFIAVLALLVVIVISDKLKKDKPVLSPAEKKAANRQLWLGGLCCGAALAMASNFQQAGMVAGTDSGKAGFLTALYVVLVPVCGLFFKRKVSLPVWIAVALSVIALYLLCINGEFSLAPGDLLILACAVCFTIHILVIDHFTATAYCTTGTTATGTYTTVNRTLAVNPSMIPYGTHVWLFFPDGTLVGDFYAEDTGSNMMEHPYVIDIYKGADSYDECMQWGAQRVSVYVSASETN